jgi:hypothetical protein
MTSNRKAKQAARSRTAETGERYTTARRREGIPKTEVEVIWTAIPEPLRSIQGDPFGFQPTRGDLKRAMEDHMLEYENEIDWWEGGDSGDLLLAVFLEDEDEAETVAAIAAVDLDGFQVIKHSGMFVACGQTFLRELGNHAFICWQIACCYPEG